MGQIHSHPASVYGGRRTCVGCGATFKGYKHARWCSDACRMRTSRGAPPVPAVRHCEHCGEPLSPTARSDARFCSGRCRVAALRKRQSA